MSCGTCCPYRGVPSLISAYVWLCSEPVEIWPSCLRPFPKSLVVPRCCPEDGLALGVGPPAYHQRLWRVAKRGSVKQSRAANAVERSNCTSRGRHKTQTQRKRKSRCSLVEYELTRLQCRTTLSLVRPTDLRSAAKEFLKKPDNSKVSRDTSKQDYRGTVYWKPTQTGRRCYGFGQWVV